jgi:hypothetical protein
MSTMMRKTWTLCIKTEDPVPVWGAGPSFFVTRGEPGRRILDPAPIEAALLYADIKIPFSIHRIENGIWWRRWESTLRGSGAK